MPWPKSGSHWHLGDLQNFRVYVRDVNTRQFFGSELPAIPSWLSPAILYGTRAPPYATRETQRYFQLLENASRFPNSEQEVDDYIEHLLELFRFNNTTNRLLIKGPSFKLPADKGEKTRSAEPDFALVRVDDIHKPTVLKELFLVEEDKVRDDTLRFSSILISSQRPISITT